jgi:SAM-dependent methyltransferase
MSILSLALALLPALQAPTRAPDVAFVPTPPEVVTAMLELAGVMPGDVIYDLGSGDGRLVIEAARRYGVRGVGIDIDAARIAEATENARRAGVADKVRFVHGDLFDADVSPATVVTLFLLPTLNVKLQPKLLQQLKPGSRIVSHAFDMAEWNPDREMIVGGRHVYLWTIDHVRAQLAAAPAGGRGRIRPIDIVTAYGATKTGADWSWITPPVDLEEPTYLQFLDRFRSLVFPDVQSHKSWFELFRLMRDEATGEYAFQYQSIEIVGGTLALSVGAVGRTATWANRATGRRYSLTIEGDRVLFAELK